MKVAAGVCDQGAVEPGTPFKKRPDDAIVHQREAGVVGRRDAVDRRAQS